MDPQERLPVLGRESLRVADICVISVLWSLEFLNTWISSLCEYTSFVFLTSEELNSTKFEKNNLAIFIVQCLGALIVAFLVDINRFQKMAVSMVGSGLFAMTTFFALGTTMSNSIWSGMIMFWMCSALFITLPVTYCLMFNQKLNASFTSVRRLVAVLEMGNALVEWMSFEALPEEVDRHTRYSIVFMWVITIPLFVLFFTMVQSIKKHVRGDFTVDTSVKSVVRGISSDLRHKQHTGRSLLHVVVFSLLLLPAMSLAILGSTLDVSSEDVSKPQDSRLENLLFAFQLLVIPLFEVVLALTHMREDKADYSILIIAHVTNVFVLVLMLANFKPVPPVKPTSDVEPSQLVRIKRGQASDAKRFSCPELGKMTILILNGVKHDVEMVPSVHFKDTPERWTISPGEYFPVIFPHVGTMMVDFEIRIVDKSLPKPPQLKGTLKLEHNYLFLMYLFGNSTFLSARNYIDAHKYKKGMAKVMYFSTLWPDVPGGTITISSEDGSYSTINPVPRANGMEFIFCPVPLRYDFTYEFNGTDEKAKTLFNKDTVQVLLEEFDDYVVYVSLTDSDSGLSINSLRVCDKPSPTITTTLRPLDVEEQTAYALVGSSLGATSVAYIHFFWVESPVRLRATMFALFRVADAVVYRFTPVITGKEVTLTKMYALLALQVGTTIAHLVLGWIFQSYISHG